VLGKGLAWQSKQFEGKKMQVTKAAVIGAGTMGHGIAQVLAQAEIEVNLIDQSHAALQAGIDQIETNLKIAVSKGKVLATDVKKILSRINPFTNLDALEGADLMVEAVSEDVGLKQEIFHRADILIDNYGILATNTSSLSVKKIAESTSNPERVVGLHFFNPPHIMKLLEIAVHDKTSEEIIDKCKLLSTTLRKESIVVKDSPGFATSRLGIAFCLEGIRMLEQGVASVKDLDTAMKLGYGHPMGPLMLSDWVGLDIRLAIAQHLYETLESPIFLPPALLRKMVRAGFLGRKSGSGFYEWDNHRALGVSQSMADFFNI
jgi:3-hydroxybutyryl-CoA dehydrogenase